MISYLERAWDAVGKSYMASRINSERTMQAVLYSQLSTILPDDAYVLCEPTINLADYGEVIPDLLILAGGTVTAAIELKFVPHHYPLYKGDLEKLKAYGTSRSEFPILVEAGTGQFSSTRFRFAENCILVFAAIGQHDSEAMDKSYLRKQMGDLASRFLPLTFPVKR